MFRELGVNRRSAGLVLVLIGSVPPGQKTTRQTMLSSCDIAAVTSPSMAAVSSCDLKKTDDQDDLFPLLN